jgi:hypothetical protein
MAPKSKSKEPPPPAEPPEEDLGPLPEFELDFVPIVTRTLTAEDVAAADVEAWACEKKKLATRLSLADASTEVLANVESELAVALTSAKQKDQEAAKEFRCLPFTVRMHNTIFTAKASRLLRIISC